MSQRLLQVIPDPYQWRLDPDLSGGATVMDNGLYPNNTTRFLLDADPVAVQARSAYSEEAFEAVGDEHVVFTLVFPDDIFAACTASQNAYDSSYLRMTGIKSKIIIYPSFFNR